MANTLPLVRAMNESQRVSERLARRDWPKVLGIFSITLRESFILTAIAALLLAWIADHRRLWLVRTGRVPALEEYMPWYETPEEKAERERREALIRSIIK